MSKVLIMGDAILDEYYFCEVSRISPEAPIPVALHKKSEYRLGGSINVFANTSLLLPEHVDLLYTSKADHAGEQLSSMLLKYQGKKIALGTDKPTIVKTRVIANGQQLLRIDKEEKVDGSVLETEITEHASHYNLVAISDYNKGFVSSNLIPQISRLKNVRILIDPKLSDWSVYKGAYLIKPNIQEFKSAAGVEYIIDNQHLVELARNLMTRFDISNVVVTRGAEGIMWISKSEVWQKSAHKVDVFDVSGAGDTVFAIIIFGVLNGLKPQEILNKAAYGAAKVISRVGTSLLRNEEIKQITDD